MKCKLYVTLQNDCSVLRFDASLLLISIYVNNTNYVLFSVQDIPNYFHIQ